ncbi:MAG: CopG family antitoxin [Dehalococcoidia bacterium]|nr:CopG family antitoxin [Dehalococcoidia bacterium]
MSEFTYKPAKAEDLEREARDWDLRELNPRGWNDAPEAVPQVRSSASISLRIPVKMLTIIKAFAQKEGVGYQILMKRWLDDRIREERDKLTPQHIVKLREPKMVALAAAFSPSKEQVLTKEK